MVPLRTTKRLAAAALASLLAGASAHVSACDAQAVSIGGAMTPVKVTAVAGGVGACSTARYAHPNVCCQATTYPATCGSFAMSPFAGCPAAYVLYPDPRTCCSLDDPDPSLCVAAPDAGSLAASACGYACVPSAFESDAGACCSMTSSGATCAAPVPAETCSEPACVTDGGCALTCPSGCGTCPTGFTVPDGGPTLCHRVDPTAGEEWFSQATGPVASSGVTVSFPDPDAGVLVGEADGGIPTTDAGTTTVEIEGGIEPPEAGVELLEGGESVSPSDAAIPSLDAGADATLVSNPPPPEGGVAILDAGVGGPPGG